MHAKTSNDDPVYQQHVHPFISFIFNPGEISIFLVLPMQQMRKLH